MQLISSLYLISGIVVALMYLPQILAVKKCQFGASSVSLLSWSIWSIATLITLIYATKYTDDGYFQVVSVLNCIGCCSVFCLTVIKKRQYKSIAALEVKENEIDKLSLTDLANIADGLEKKKGLSKTPSEYHRVEKLMFRIKDALSRRISELDVSS